MASVLAIKLHKCSHKDDGKKIVRSVSHRSTLFELFEEVHGPVDFKTVRVSVAVGKNVDGASTFQMEGHICIGNLYESLGMKYVEFSCKQNEDIHLGGGGCTST
jgi:hypothetical protein